MGEGVTCITATLLLLAVVISKFRFQVRVFFKTKKETKTSNLHFLKFSFVFPSVARKRYGGGGGV